MKLAIKIAINDLMLPPKSIPLLRVLRQRKIIAEWLEKNYAQTEKDNLIAAMKAVYTKSLQDGRFDIHQFIEEYIKE
jgi:hypothetical protein